MFSKRSTGRYSSIIKAKQNMSSHNASSIRETENAGSPVAKRSNACSPTNLIDTTLRVSEAKDIEFPDVSPCLWDKMTHTSTIGINKQTKDFNRRLDHGNRECPSIVHVFPCI
mmetsp:Transcript_28651/g.69415  ORF Transcript_28651/g.69415 Transcript_28651/m.69415 type:complete len:113 (-) Transcript_28651:3228-3566(-)